jgi:hypothetical protein
MDNIEQYLEELRQTIEDENELIDGLAELPTRNGLDK